MKMHRLGLAAALAVVACACRPPTPEEVDADNARFCRQLCGDCSLDECAAVVDEMIAESCGGEDGPCDW